jgi:2,4-diketo-3-deoxy-L-fuconate hydrolase
MRLMRIGTKGNERPVVTADALTFDARPVTDDYHPEFFASGGLARLRDALFALPPTDITGQRVGAPIARPAAIICIGQNYAAHALESGDAPPERPIIFFKHPNTLVGPDDVVPIPKGATTTDWEVELAVVIGQEARYLSSPDDALACVAGYAVSNDVSERTFQTKLSGGQWSKGKCCEAFNPFGPALVVDEVTDPQALRLRSWVNGEARQDSSTADMIFPVAELIHHLSQFLVLSPGDIMNTGTPQGVAFSGKHPYLTAGDVMELEIESLGRQRQELSAWSGPLG